MFDVFSRATDQAIQRGVFLSSEQIDTLLRIIAEGAQRLDIVRQLTSNVTQIVTNTARTLFIEQPDLIAPGGNAYTNRRMATCLRDIEIILRYITYAMFSGDPSILEERCLNGLRETYLALGTSPSSVGRAIQIMKDIVISDANLPENYSITLISELSGYFDRTLASLDSNLVLNERTMTNSYFDYAQDSYLSYVKRLTQKRIATDEELAMYHRLSDGRVEIKSGDRVFLLEKGDDQDRLDSEERRQANATHPYWNNTTNAPEKSGCPDQVDRRNYQTPIKDQDIRGTCVAHAALANLEAILKSQGLLDIDLSEQYAHWLFMRLQGLDQCYDGIRTTLAARYLAQEGVCKEEDCIYEDFKTVQTHCNSTPSLQAKRNAIYGIEQYALIDRIGFFGPSIANSDYLEAILCHGHDIVLGIYVAWGNPDEDGVYDVLLDRYGNPQATDPDQGHAMLIVGYNRSAAIPYFICKNSWGVTDGVNGYWYLSYDYIRTYAKYGYITLKICLDMPTQ